jgi:23S rRNA pseudouridine1911/1915/1917 synthase
VREKVRTLGRQALHSESLGIIHPRSEEFMEFNAPLPEDMEKIIRFLSQYEEEHLPQGKE